MTDAREAATMAVNMHDEGTVYGEYLAEQIIKRFADAPKTTALVQEVAAHAAQNFEFRGYAAPVSI